MKLIFNVACLIASGSLVLSTSRVSSGGPANATATSTSAPSLEQTPGPYDPVSFICHDNGFNLKTRRNHSVVNRALPGDWTTTCEHQVMSLDCGRGKVLRIIDVEYGRFDTTTCHHYPMFFMRCEATDAYHKVHMRCDNKQRCTVNANSEEFGDPCPGIVKYLRVKHRCEAVSPGELKSKTICENDKGEISCPEGKTIMIADAFYGRTDRTTCPHEKILTTDCRAPHSLDIIAGRCDHKMYCNLTSANSQFEDPCRGTYKYIQVDYQCVVDDLQLGVACEGTELVLECKNMSFINVVRAEYGRGHPFVCNFGNRRIAPEGCSSPNEISVTFGRCQGKSKCTLPASSTVFGEPCIGKPKYLEVDFFCSERFVESDSGGAPRITALWKDRVTLVSDKLNGTTSKGYIAQIRDARDKEWFTVMDTDNEPFDFSKPHTIGGLSPDDQFDARIIKKKGVESSCIPFTRMRARKQ